MGGWAAIFWARNFSDLMIGRILTGLGSGLGTPAAYIILSDLSLIKFRGIMATLNSFANNFAWLIGLILGKYFSLNNLILSYSIPPAMFLLVSLLLPESPLWLTKKGMEKEAEEVLKFIRGSDYPVQVEAKELAACVQSNEVGDKKWTKELKYYSTTKAFLTPLGILLFLSLIQGSCGVDTISYYSLKIFRMAKVSVDEYVMAILLQVFHSSSFKKGLGMSL